jgi:UDP-N-acetylglucosamine 2-epimerase
VLFTAPNADPESRVIRRRLREAGAAVVEELGSPAYFALMSRAAAMVGNSSSGLIEAPSVGLPVVNVGPRQDGRIRARSVIDVACSRGAIAAGLRRALSPAFRRGLRGLRNPNGTGKASALIADVLARAELGPRLLVKRFADA